VATASPDCGRASAGRAGPSPAAVPRISAPSHQRTENPATPAKGTTCFRNFSIGNDLFTTMFTAQMGRGKLHLGSDPGGMEAQLGDKQPQSTRRVPGRSEVFTHFVPGPQPVNTPNAPSPHSHEGNDSRDSRRRYTSRLIVLKHNVRGVSTDELEYTSVTQFTPGSNLRARSSRGRSARVMESMLQLICAMEASGDECMCVCTHARASRCRRRRVHAHRTVLLWAYTYPNKPYI